VLKTKFVSSAAKALLKKDWSKPNFICLSITHKFHFWYMHYVKNKDLCYILK